MSPTSKEAYIDLLRSISSQISPKVDDLMTKKFKEAAEATDRNTKIDLARKAQRIPQVEEDILKLMQEEDPLTKLLKEYDLQDTDFDVVIARSGTVFEAGEERSRGDEEISGFSTLSAAVISAIVSKNERGEFVHKSRKSLHSAVKELVGDDPHKIMAAINIGKKYFKDAIEFSNETLLESIKEERVEKVGRRSTKPILIKEILNNSGIEAKKRNKDSSTRKDPLDYIGNGASRTLYKFIRKEYGGMTLQQFNTEILSRKELGFRPEAVVKFNSRKILQTIQNSPRTEAVLCNAIRSRLDVLSNSVFGGKDALKIAISKGWKYEGDLDKILEASCFKSAEKDINKQPMNDALKIIRESVSAMAENRKGLHPIKKLNLPAWNLIYCWVSELGKDYSKIDQMLELLFPGVQYKVEDGFVK